MTGAGARGRRDEAVGRRRRQLVVVGGERLVGDEHRPALVA
jgi:hypothetical protein